ncbi:MAG: O-acetyl-ADP-ribose deacetylase [Coriobacteriia bacterium]|nr:O-acetyl-ADP-ribose deacetylase [Coriobacteriia bacterium]
MEVVGGTLRLVPGDITRFDGDAIVNAANPGLLGGGGVDGAIHRAAGRSLYEECKRIVEKRGPLPPGQAVMTTGGMLPARHVIHTVGPVWHGGDSGEADTLASAYRESLRLAAASGLARLAFPSISTGAYGYPVREAAGVALRAVRESLASLAGEGAAPMDVTFVLFDAPTFAAYAEALETIGGG